MEYMALFFTHSGAVKFDRSLKQKGYKSQPVPITRKLSSSCGIGVKFNFDGDLDDIISQDVERIYEIIESEYVLVYSCDD